MQHPNQIKIIQPANTRTHKQPARRAFSMIELLVALTISATLLTSTLVSFDAMFKGYEQTAETASNHIVSRIALNRMLAMVRTGDRFGPFPNDVLDGTKNPLIADYFEFVSARNKDTGVIEQVTRLEYRYPEEGALLRSWGASEDPPALDFTPTGPGAIWIVITNLVEDETKEFLLLDNVRSSTYTMTYDVGPRLMRSTIDIIVEAAEEGDIDIATGAIPATVRLVASAMPRRSMK